MQSITTEQGSPAPPTRTLDVAMFRHVRDKIPRPSALTVDELRDQHRAAVEVALVDVEPKGEAKAQGAAFSPARYRPGEMRSKAGVEAVSALVLDLDNVTTEIVGDVFARLDGLCAWGWTTWGSGWAKLPGAWRVVVPLAVDVEAGPWPEVWKLLVERLAPSADPATKDASRLHFLPRAPRRVPGSDGELVDNTPPLWREQDGELFDPSEIVERVRLQHAQREQARRDAEVARDRVKATAPVATAARDRRYGEAALEDECARVRGARRGADWHPTLNKAGFAVGQLCAAGLLDEENAKRRLLEAAATVIVPGDRNYDQREAERVLFGGLEAGKKHPRVIPERASSAKRWPWSWICPRGSK